MSHTRSHEEVLPSAIFHTISEGIAAGRTIVPILGAGISIGAGIPSSLELGRYLAKIIWLGFSPEQLRVGWPDSLSLHIATAKAMKTRNCLGCAALFRDVIRSQVDDLRWMESDSNVETWSSSFVNNLLASRWRLLLSRATGNQPALLTAFVRAITDHRVPSKGHLFAAFLTQLLGTRLIVTTNFDGLLETALTDQSLRPHAFICTPEQPLTQLSVPTDRPTVLKLHGDAPLTLTDESLNSPLPDHHAAALREVLPRSPLFVVVGYSCRDRRVAHLLNTLLANATTDTLPSLVWVCRNTMPLQLPLLSSNLRPKSIQLARYGDAALFLQELYARLATSLPPSPAPYSILTHGQLETRGLPSTRHNDIASDRSPYRVDAKAIPEPFVVFYSKDLGAGTSSYLSDFAKQVSSTHRIIWCDAEEFASVDSLTTYILAQLRQHDPTVPVVAMPPIPSSLRSGTATDDVPDSVDPRFQRLIQGLTRGQYLLAIDSIGEFGRSCLSHDVGHTASKTFEQALARLYKFIENLAAAANRIGSSRIAVAITAVEIRDQADQLATAAAELSKSLAINADQTIASTVLATDPANLEERSSEMELTLGPVNRIATESTPEDFGIPRQIGTYSVVRVVGTGARGIVVLLDDPKYAQPRVAKVLRTVPTSEHERLAFSEEVRHVDKLRHRAILQIHEVSALPDGRPYIVSDFVDGWSLRQFLGGKPIDWRTAAKIVIQVAEALHNAHSLDIIHRDIKPENILIARNGQAYVADFGLARTARYRTQPGHISGTIEYMSPEQTLGNSLSPASDLFSLGIVLYECLTGLSPFRRRDINATLMAIRNDAPRPPASLTKGIPNQLDGTCIRALNKLVGKRHRHAQQFADELSERLRRDREQHSFEVSSNSPAQVAVRKFNALKGRLENGSAYGNVRLIQASSGNYQYCTEQTADVISRIVNEEMVSRTSQISGWIEAHGNTALSAIEVLWSNLSAIAQKVLAICATFRRPRNIVGLRKIGSAALAAGSESLELCFSRIVASQRSPFAFQESYAEVSTETTLIGLNIVHESRFKDVDEILSDLEAADLIVRQAGGNYWMHSKLRNYAYERVCAEAPDGVGMLHEAVAAYYYEDLYLPSSDAEAFYEFVFHQSAAMRQSDRQELYRRTRTLECAFLRERESLLAGGGSHLGRILECLYELRDDVLAHLITENDKQLTSGASNFIEDDYGTRAEDKSSLPEALRRMRALCCDLIGEAWRLAGHYRECLEIRIGQILDRLDDLHIAVPIGLREAATNHKESLPLVTAAVRTSMATTLQQVCDLNSHLVWRLVEHCFDVAVCLEGLYEFECARSLFDAIELAVADYQSAIGPAHRQNASSSALMRGRATLRCLQMFDTTMDIWNPEMISQRQLRAFRSLLDKATVLLDDYPVVQGLKVHAHLTHIRLYEAKLFYVFGDFDEAYRRIDSARALVMPRSEGESASALAPCELRKAECAILHANAMLCCAEPLSDSSFASQASMARSRLTLAEDAIRHCGELLDDMRGSVRYWALYYLYKAQLHHERVLLAFHHRNGGMAVVNIEKVRDDLVLSLKAIGAGLDNIASHDLMRRSPFETLWWQLYAALLLVVNVETLRTLGPAPRFDTAWAEWEGLNKESSCDHLLDNERRTRFERLEVRWTAAWSQAVLTRKAFASVRERVIEIQCHLLDNRAALFRAVETLASDESIGVMHEKIRHLADTTSSLQGLFQKVLASCEDSVVQV